MPPFSGHPSSSLSTHPSFLLATHLVSIATVWSFQEFSINETTSVQPLELFFPPQCDSPEIHSYSSTPHQLLHLYCHRPGDPGPLAHFLLSTSPVVVEDMDLFYVFLFNLDTVPSLFGLVALVRTSNRSHWEKRLKTVNIQIWNFQTIERENCCKEITQNSSDKSKE